MKDQGFGFADAIREAGISYRQLQYWDERKIIQPRQTKHRRLYSAAQIAELAIAKELRQRHIGLRLILSILKFLRREFGDMLGIPARSLLLTDGKKNYAVVTWSEKIKDMKLAKGPMFLVPIGEIAYRVEESMAVLVYNSNQ